GGHDRLAAIERDVDMDAGGVEGALGGLELGRQVRFQRVFLCHFDDVYQAEFRFFRGHDRGGEIDRVLVAAASGDWNEHSLVGQCRSSSVSAWAVKQLATNR